MQENPSAFNLFSVQFHYELHMFYTLFQLPGLILVFWSQ